MSAAKMTPGPWQTGIGQSSIWAGEHRIITYIENDADARAIAALPELVEAARATVKAYRFDDIDVIHNLRRILARIEGEGE